jgi:hypothetical protein
MVDSESTCNGGRNRDWDCEQASGRWQLLERPTVFMKRKGIGETFLRREERGDKIIEGETAKGGRMDGT